MSKVVVKFYLNEQFISSKPMNSQDNLKTVREKLKEKICDFQQFLSKDGELIDISDEDSFTIGDIINESRIINVKEMGDKNEAEIKLNDKIISTVQVDTKTKLSDIRKLIQNIPESAHFYTLDNEIIEKEDEETFLLEDIINNLKNEKENIITVGICLNGKPLINKQLNENLFLSDIRKEIENVKNIPKEFVFENQKGFKILTDDEQSLKLSSILYDNTINIIAEEVLKIREQINTQIEGLRKSLNNALSKLSEIKRTYEQISFYRDKVNNNKDYTFTVSVTVQKMVDLKPGEYITNCLYCHKTCCYPCDIKGDIKDGCCCIGANGYCKICGCHYTQHANSRYRFEYVTETKQQTAQEVLQRYNEGKKGIANAENMLKKLEEEYYKIQTECYDKQVKIVERINRLSEIAPNNKVNGFNEYLDQLIQTENDEKKSGYQERIKGYNQLKQSNEITEYIMKKSGSKKSMEEIWAEVERKMKELK
ncbi:hypothetical protein, conserved [Entamoeba dispar SAW760]|uniref:Uncharacterized protein n=1 Tax=Entamoeba dispar (strain ATCC PRA-260 / SAW760) TaxID=370354 RepID=B0EFT0_ENTDS|nr:uncharacterized protein EDI_069860 [Entamoeba dispar SAW760]EDR26616.1 hypothetical protein, conserved [Entamoeba dispar SAW760]|eukprot:EDR26616.1 hypothetical protein, conserved [Entamoeba dispar SAW760]